MPPFKVSCLAGFLHVLTIPDITLVTPATASAAISTALATNPYLTSLPSPRPVLLAPKGLDQTTGTAHIFRLPEVQAAITGDFIVLPCDLVCELGGESLLEAWMVREAGLGGATGGSDEYTGPKMAFGGERGGRRGGLAVWYPTKGDIVIKGEETDFVATSPLSPVTDSLQKGALLNETAELVYSVPTDTLRDIVDEKKSLPIRHSLLKHHPRVRMLSSHRDAHLYIFPAWIMDFIKQNEHMDNLSEDVIGWWAKAGWQDRLGDKLGMRQIFFPESALKVDDLHRSSRMLDEVDVRGLSSTWTEKSASNTDPTMRHNSMMSPKASDPDSQGGTFNPYVIPPILAYIHPSKSAHPLVRRVDTAPLLLSVSLQLAKLEAIEQVGRSASSPFAHANKIAHQAGVAAKCTVSRADCLLADNVTVEERCAIKECVIGSNCRIQQGAKLTRCVLMDGVVVGKGCKITGTILGRRSEIGEDSVLQDCEVEDNMRIEANSESTTTSLGTHSRELTILPIQRRRRRRNLRALQASKQRTKRWPMPSPICMRMKATQCHKSRYRIT